MLLRGFPPAYALLLLLFVTLFFFWTFASGPHFGSSILHQDASPSSPANKASLTPVDQAHESIAKPDSHDSPVQHRPANEILFQWKTRKEDYPVPTEAAIALPTETPLSIPRIQHNFTNTPKDEEYLKRLSDRRSDIKKALKRCWEGYKTFAYGKDELAVESASSREHFGGWGATLVDTLDTLWIVGMEEEFKDALMVLKDIDFSWTGLKTINVFETNIRYLGGLLAAHDLTGGKYPVLLEKAVEVGDLLYASFDTPNRMPLTRWVWKNARDGVRQEAETQVLLAELGSMSLEFTRLSQLTNNSKYFDAIQRVTNVLEMKQNVTKIPGLWPTVVNAKFVDNLVENNLFTLSSMADSTYEYLPKQYLLLGGHSKQSHKMYEAAIDTAKTTLFYRPMTKDKKDILLSGNASVDNKGKVLLDPEGQHLSCYIPGMLAIGSKVFDRVDDLNVAKKLLDGCLWASENTPTGIMPEVFHTIPCKDNTACEWDKETWFKDVAARYSQFGVTAENVHWKVLEQRLYPGFADIPDRRYILRPELIESMFIMYRITGDTDIRDRAWRLWETIDRITKSRYGNAAVGDVTTNPPEHTDYMESFWTAETLKYFYLMFEDESVLSLDNWVFSTEAHPFKRPV